MHTCKLLVLACKRIDLVPFILQVIDSTADAAVVCLVLVNAIESRVAQKHHQHLEFLQLFYCPHFALLGARIVPLQMCIESLGHLLEAISTELSAWYLGVCPLQVSVGSLGNYIECRLHLHFFAWCWVDRETFISAFDSERRATLFSGLGWGLAICCELFCNPVFGLLLSTPILGIIPLLQEETRGDGDP